MIKVIGALLIISGTAVWGAGSVMRLRNRTKALDAIVTSLDIMRNEISANLTPMKELIELLVNIAPEGAKGFFKEVCNGFGKLGSIRLAEIWSDAVKGWGHGLLTENESQILVDLGTGLGKYDCDSQCRVIESAKRRMTVMADKAERDRDANSKLHAFLGVAAGMFAVVVLI